MDKQAIAQSFGDAAICYDQHAQFQRQVAAKLAQQVISPNIDNAVVLDLGCGSGLSSAQLQQQMATEHYFALDMARPMLQFAAQRYPKLHYIQADAEFLPVADQTIDLVYSSLALQWVDDPTAVLKEIKRVLKVGAQAHIATLGEHSLFELKQAWGQVDQHQHVNDFHSVQQWQQAAATSGLKLQLRQQKQVLKYSSVMQLARDLKGIGAHNINNNRAKGLTGKGRFKHMCKHYESFRNDATYLPASYQVIYLRCTN